MAEQAVGVVNEIKEMEGTIRGLVQRKQVITTNMTRPDFVAKSIADHQKTIDHCRKMQQDMLTSIEKGPEMVEAIDAQIARIRGRINELKHRRDIDKMGTLMEKIAELRAQGIDVDAFLAAQRELTAEQVEQVDAEEDELPVTEATEAEEDAVGEDELREAGVTAEAEEERAGS